MRAPPRGPLSEHRPPCAWQGEYGNHFYMVDQGCFNVFLKQLDVTFRRDPCNHRPRVNKKHSAKDVEQKRAGTFFFLDADD